MLSYNLRNNNFESMKFTVFIYYIFISKSNYKYFFNLLIIVKIFAFFALLH